MNLKITQLEYPTLEMAWEGINEYLVNNEEKVKAAGGANYSTELVLYDTFIHIFKSHINPDFNFGKVLGYRYKKWSKLINNYVNLDYLDLIKSEVVAREGRKSAHYTFSMHFDNAHGSGKDCLIALTFCRRKGQDNPFVIFNTRASEVTSRMLFDFLLIQRIVEYVYGENKTVEVVCSIPFLFVNIERFLIYMAYKGRKCIKKQRVYGPTIDEETGEEIMDRRRPPKVIKKYYTPYQNKCIEKFDKFFNTPLDDIKYRVHKRAAIQVQGATDHIPDLFAKELTLPFKPKLKERDIEKLNNSMD
jgi:hypothetical protein